MGQALRVWERIEQLLNYDSICDEGLGLLAGSWRDPWILDVATTTCLLRLT